VKTFDQNIKEASEIERLVGGFLEYMQIERGASPLTVRDYRHYLSRFAAWFLTVDPSGLVGRINLDNVRRYRVYLGSIGLSGNDPVVRPLKRVTQNYHVISLRAFLRWLSKNDYQVLSAEKIELPKAESRSIKFLGLDELTRLLSMPVVSEPIGLRDKAVMELLFSTGLRVSELVRLDRSSVDFKAKEFGVIGKGGKARVVFLSERAAAWVEKYLSVRQDEWDPLFVAARSRKTGLLSQDPTVKHNKRLGEKMRLSVRSVQRIVEKYVRKAGLTVKISPHGIRHSFATDLLRAGADIRSVQEMLGHKNISTTQIYTHVTNIQLRGIHEKYHGRGRT